MCVTTKRHAHSNVIKILHAFEDFFPKPEMGKSQNMYLQTIKLYLSY